MEKVLITGANGFIGSHVVEYFVSQGVRVGCLVRKTSNTQNIRDVDVDLEYGDIENYSGLVRIVSKYDRVVHIAGLATDWGKYKRFYEANVIGTLNVLKACKQNNKNDIIITQSISVYGEEDCKLVKDENSPLNSHYEYFLDKIFPSAMNHYRDSRANSKIEAIKYAQDNNLNITIIEPAWVYGEREFHSGFYEYMKTVKTGVPFLPGSKTNKFHVIYAKDLARAYYMAYTKKLEGINSFIIGNDKVETMDHLYIMICKELGVVKPINIPKLVIYPVGLVLEMVYTILNIKKPPILTRARVNMLYDNIEYSTNKSKEILGFTAEYSLEESIKRTVEWYKNKGLI